MRKIYLAEHRGFCSGVVRALDIVTHMLESGCRPVYVRHAIVHNNHIVRELGDAGVVFVENLDEVPKGGTVIFSAHGVSPEVERKAREMGLKTVDATCPRVKKIHEKATALRNEGYTILLIGNRDHPETCGTLGHIGEGGVVVENREDAENLNLPDTSAAVTYLTQTTLSTEDVSGIVEVLQRRIPKLVEPDRNDICDATLKRQAAVKELTRKCGTILVIGSEASSNSRKLRDMAAAAGADAYLIDSFRDIPDVVVENAGDIGISSGASAPEELVLETINFLTTHGFEPPEGYY
ncbi:MAG: 4-hydroxy-3-methylbut-2-enyl diphosphate reductase [Victivallales bacterium]|nr:4-hydroxy-3-methylbut-2-enyl diphosphate reductase [Victivallales bacterium]